MSRMTRTSVSCCLCGLCLEFSEKQDTPFHVCMLDMKLELGDSPLSLDEQLAWLRPHVFIHSVLLKKKNL